MITTIPRCVWSCVFEYLSYSERCKLRTVCKFFRPLKNRQPLSYWLARRDEITKCLGWQAILHWQLRNGVKRPFPNKSAFQLSALLGGVSDAYFTHRHPMFVMKKLIQIKRADLIERFFNQCQDDGAVCYYYLYKRETEKLFPYISAWGTEIHLNALKTKNIELIKKCREYMRPEVYSTNTLLFHVFIKNRFQYYNKIGRTFGVKLEYFAKHACKTRNLDTLRILKQMPQYTGICIGRALKTLNIKIISLVAKYERIYWITRAIKKLIKKGRLHLVKILIRIWF